MLSGRIICGLLADRTGATPTLVACLALQAVAIALYLVARDLDTLYAVSMLFGLLRRRDAAVRDPGA